MNLYTVIFYGTDSDGDPDVVSVHVRPKVAGREAALKAGRRQLSRMGCSSDRFYGQAPYVFQGHLQEIPEEASDAN